jgi:DNA-binding transcriptional regulator YdaS (Cro superfamily)
MTKSPVERIQQIIECAVSVAGTQRGLARELGVSSSSICEWVSGRVIPRAEHFIILQDYLNGERKESEVAQCNEKLLTSE